MKTLGIIGGVGPESTIDYYRAIVALYRERKPDGSYPSLIINSIDLKKIVDLVTRNDVKGVANYLLDGIDKLARASADFGLVAANTPHIVFDVVQAQSPLPLISIVEAACSAAKTQALKRLALFGTRFTMQGTFYPKVFARERIELIIPDADDREYIHDKYMNELILGKFLPETRAGLLAVVDRLQEKVDLDGVILAGTELPLILREATHNGIPLLDTTRIHVEAALTEILS